MFVRLPSLRTFTIAAATLAALGGAAAWPASAGRAEQDTPDLGAGVWDISTRIDHLEIPGLPEPMVRKIAADPANAKPRGVCIASSARTPPPIALFHTLNGTCRYEAWQAAAGSLRAVLVCSTPGGGPGEAKVEVSGTYTDTAFKVASETIARDAAGETQLHMRSTIWGTLTSSGADCPRPE